METTKKVAVIYDQELDFLRVEEAAKALESLGYTVKSYDQTQGDALLDYLANDKPALLVTSSMLKERPSGMAAIRFAAQADVPGVMYSWNSGHGADVREQEALDRLPAAGFYQYPDYGNFDVAGFLEVVNATLGKASAAKAPHIPAIDPANVNASRPQHRVVD